jgi:GT2 family glycosyltransferase
MRLLIVIVNYRTADLTIDCLRSLEPELRAIGGGDIPSDVRVCVTDGKSPDDSVARLTGAIAANNWGRWCDLRPLDVNGGFAYGNNAGIRPYLESADKPELVMLLNPDTIVRPGAIQTMLDFMARRTDVAIAGSRTENPDGTPQSSAFRFHGIASEFEMATRFRPVTRLLKQYMVAPPPGDAEQQVDWVVGASMMIRRAVFEKIGLLDDGYFMYFEETDFCLRARRAGFTCWYVPSARIVHLIGQSSGIGTAPNQPQKKRRPAYWFQARRRYLTKNHGLLYTALADAAFILGFSSWRLRRVLQRRPDPDPDRFLGDFIRQSVFVKGRA